MKTTNKMPILFIGHGSPMNALANNSYTMALNNLGNTLPIPKSILIISAHWETNGTFITGMKNPKTIYDFHGFPKELYQIIYPAPGSPELAYNLYEKAIATIDDKLWGLDHGSWTILKHIYPKANIPVVQLSLDRSKSMRHHYQLGKELSTLRDEGVLIIGSGDLVHNLNSIKWNEDAKAYDWAIEFDKWCINKLQDRDFNALIDDPLKSKIGHMSHPTTEHYLPLLYVIGASCEADKLLFEYEGIQNGSISMTSFKFN